MKLIDITETFEKDLQDPEFIRFYLEEALNDGQANFLMALRQVIKANDGIGTLLYRNSLRRLQPFHLRCRQAQELNHLLNVHAARQQIAGGLQQLSLGLFLCQSFLFSIS